jgi:hypothetical protein
LVIVGQKAPQCQCRLTVNSNLCAGTARFLNAGHKMSHRNLLRHCDDSIDPTGPAATGYTSIILPYGTIVIVLKIGLVSLYLLIYQANLAPLQKSYIGFRSL